MPGSKKRKVASDLPDPLELLANFKAAKRSVKTAFDALLSLDLLQCPNELLEKLGENEKLAWLIAKFGWNTVSPVGECLRSFPTALTESQRSCLFEKSYPDISTCTYQQISSFLICNVIWRKSSISNDIIIIVIYLPIRNHSWVSFQGFAEAYNDTFSINKENGEVVYGSTVCVN